MTRTDVFDRVWAVLSDTMQSSGRPAPLLSESSHLLADLGLTSVDFAEVTIGLEESLEIREFPITDWLKRESQRTDAGAFTVGALVDACVPLVATESLVSSEASEGPSIRERVARDVEAPRPSGKAPKPAAWTVLAVVFCVAMAGLAFASF